MTIDVHGQLQQRVGRSHATSLAEIIRTRRQQKPANESPLEGGSRPQRTSKQRSAKAAVNAEPDSLIEPLRRVADRDGKRPLRGTHGAEPVAAADDKRGS